MGIETRNQDEHDETISPPMAHPTDKPHNVENMKKIVPEKEIGEFLNSKEGEKHLRGINQCWACVDGRVKRWGAQCSPGSGVIEKRDPETVKEMRSNKKKYLAGKMSRTAYLESLADAMPSDENFVNWIEQVEKGEINEITWHPECGATTLYLNDKKGLKDVTHSEVDYVAERFVRNLVDEINKRSKKKVKVGKSENEKKHHEETWTAVDATKRLDLEAEDSGYSLGDAFVVSPNLSPKKIIDHTLLTVGIAMGSHGKGKDAFSKENPYRIVLVDCEEFPLPKDLEKKMEKAVKKSPYADRVVVDYTSVKIPEGELAAND